MKTWLNYFREISAIPRGSYKEAQIAQYLVDFANANNLSVIRDSAHNVFIRKKASAGYESAPAILLQGHTDMVCEKNGDVAHDFSTEGIRVIQDGDILRAEGTTLGADNGYAVALMMALLADNTLQHPEMECLFTSAEEVGMDGMRAFDKTLLHSQRMLNVDSCEESCATAACAGGVRTKLVRDNKAESCTDNAVRLTVKGLIGGHSGEDISRGRANALKLCARILSQIPPEQNLRLIQMDGGSKDNAIPRECTAMFTVNDIAAVKDTLLSCADKIKRELSKDDANFLADITTEPYDGSVLCAEDTIRTIALLRTLPCGPLQMSHDIPGLVQTSSNTAIVHASGARTEVTLSSRSSCETQLDDVCALVETNAALCGFTCTHSGRYPGWDFRRDSELQSIYLRSAKEVLGIDANIIGIHAGLECGLLSHELPEMDMISIGPNMYDIHTPDERMSVSSGDRVYDLVVHMLASMK